MNSVVKIERSDAPLDILMNAAQPLLPPGDSEFEASSADSSGAYESVSSDSELEALIERREPVIALRSIWCSHTHPFAQIPAPPNYANGSRSYDQRRRFTERLLM